MPGCWLSRSSTSAPRVAPLPWTVLLPPVWVRRMVGIRTSMAMACGSPCELGCEGAAGRRVRASDRANARSPPPIPGGGAAHASVVDDGRRRVTEQVGLDDVDLLLRHLPVDDAEASELDLVARQPRLLLVLPRRDQHVVRVRLGGVA